MESIFRELAGNTVLWTAAASWFIAQFIKFLVDLCKNRRISLYVLLLSTGGMPSSHSSFVVALMTAVGFKEGWRSSLFALSAALSLVTMVDAAGIRRAAGKQAAVLNMMIENLNDPNISIDQKLRELLGHTPVEVGAGALLGAAVGVFANVLCGYV